MIKGLPRIFTLKGYPTIRNVLVLGCGGTGTFVIGHLARFLSTKHIADLTIADGDVVEEKNLIRQNFISRDIGKNKAEVLAERYAAAFGLSVSAITNNIEKASDFPKFSGESILIIGCVDNNASRKLIHKTFFTKPQSQAVFWIDSGNEECNGQVICGYAPPMLTYYGPAINIHRDSDKTEGIFSLPVVTEVYPEILADKSKFNSELSCAERAISAPQNMMTNATAATAVMNYAQNVLLRMPLASHGVEFSIRNTFTTRLNVKENLSVVNQDRKIERENYGSNR